MCLATSFNTNKRTRIRSPEQTIIRDCRLYSQVVKQQENLYNAEFQIQQLERKVARAGGSRSDEETRLLTAKIAGITETLDERVAEHNMLTASVKRAEDDLAAARRRNLELKAFGSDVTGRAQD